jgi:hypothetical protein
VYEIRAFGFQPDISGFYLTALTTRDVSNPAIIAPAIPVRRTARL